MSFEALTQEVKKFPFQEIRYDIANYLELVIDFKFARDLCPMLECHFGPPLKPAGKEPTPEAKKYTDRLGGIQKNQVLYYMRDENMSQCVMLWPWEDQTHVTVKIARTH